MPKFSERLAHAWNAFRGRDHPVDYQNLGISSYTRPDRYRMRIQNERSFITAIYNRIAMDVSSVELLHARIDRNGRYMETIDSSLNTCLSLEANLDQSGRAFIQDIVVSLCDEGCIAVVPIDTDIDPDTGAFKISSIRVGQITQWFPSHVRVKLYNEKTGKKEEILVRKQSTAIIENPFFTIMNEPNSILQRLVHKMALLDAIDEQASAGKLDLIIQLPYIVKSEARREQANKRRKEIEEQLTNTKYGIAYTDGTEHITQLNRPLENNLMQQIEYLTTTLYSQLGITPEILNGTANEQALLNYNNRVVEPFLSAITDEFNRKFLTKTARSQGQAIMFIRDPFKLIPVNNIAEIADKFTRNAIMSTNEVRALIGFKKVDDIQADELRNKNLNQEENVDAPIAVDGYEDEDYSKWK